MLKCTPNETTKTAKYEVLERYTVKSDLAILFHCINHTRMLSRSDSV